MRIWIKTKEEGKLYSFDLDRNDHVKSLKSQIHLKEGTPPDQQYLIHNSTRLDENHALTDYDIENKTVLMIKVEQSLLLKSSKIFKNSKIIDRIHQSYIDLTINRNEDDVNFLLVEAFSFLDVNMETSLANEVFSLIISCFSYYPTQSLKTLDKRLQNPNFTAYHVLIIPAILSYLAQFSPNISTSGYDHFISSFYQQVVSQNFNSDDYLLNIFNYEIPQSFKPEFIMNLVLMTKLTKDVVLTFYHYIFSHRSISISKINFFIQKLFEANLMSNIPESLFFKNDLYKSFTSENIKKILYSCTKQAFITIYSELEDDLIEKNRQDALFPIKIVQKCIDFDIRPKKIEELLGRFDIATNSPSWDYMDKYNIKLPDNVITRNLKYPRKPYVIKIFPNVISLSSGFVTTCLQETADMKIYEAALSTDHFRSYLFSTIDFWKHILSIVSLQKENCSSSLIQRFAYYFSRDVSEDEFIDFYVQLIFDKYPPDEKQSEFLVSLLKSMPERYISTFYEDRNAQKILNALFRTNMIPPRSLCELFYFVTKPPQITPSLMYCFEFSYLRYDSTVWQTVKIIPPIKSANLIIEFIKSKNNFDLLKNMDPEWLSLIVSSFIFTSNVHPIEVFGLNAENVLPFFAIYFNYLQTLSDEDYVTKLLSQNIIDLIIEACRKLANNDNSLMIASIDSILSNMNYLFNPRYFPLGVTLEMTTILVELLLNKSFKGNQSLLLLIIFRLSSENSDPLIQEFTITFVQRNVDSLFNFIVKNLSLIVNNDLFDGYQLNMNLFDSAKISNFFSNLIDNYMSISDVILFIKKYSIYCPKLHFENHKNVASTLQYAIDKEKWNEASIIIDFIKEYNVKVDIEKLMKMKISFDISEKLFKPTDYTNSVDIVTHILSDPNIEHNQNLFKILFDFLMKDMLTSAYYITCCLEKYTVGMQLKPEIIIQNLSDLYDNYSEVFADALQYFYAYSSLNNVFVKRINIQPLPPPSPDFSFLVKLIEENSFQSFVCLQNIASSFPFYFEQNPMKVIDIVLPSLDYIPSIFNDEADKETIYNIKKGFAALAFLYSCLYSTNFIFVFVDYSFQNIGVMSNSQVYCLSFVLHSLFRTERVNKVVHAMSMKNNFLNIILILLYRNIEDKVFKKYYYNSLYDLLIEYYKLFFEIKHDDSLYIDQVLKNEIQNPFAVEFNNFSTITQVTIQPLNIVFPKNSFSIEILNSMKAIFQPKIFWIFNNLKNSNSQPSNNLSAFINMLKPNNKEFVDKPLPSASFSNTVKIHRILLSQPKWVFNWILKQTHFPLLSAQYEYIVQLIIFLKKSVDSSDPENVEFKNQLVLPVHFLPLFYQKNLFVELFDELNIPSIPKESLLNTITYVATNLEALRFIFHVIKETLCKSEVNLLTLEKFKSQIDLIFHLLKVNESARSLFTSDCLHKLNEVVMLPTFRMNLECLLNVTDLVFKYTKVHPDQIVHLVSYVFIANNYRFFQKGIDYYTMLSKDEAKYVQPVIIKSLSSSINNEYLTFKEIKALYERFPSFKKGTISSLSNYLNNAIVKLQARKYKDAALSELVIEIFNYLTPEKGVGMSKKLKVSVYNSSTTNNKNDSTEKSFLSNRLPPYLISEAPFFWREIYLEHYGFLSHFVKSDQAVIDRLKFISTFFELVPFRTRFNKFKQQVDRRFKDNNRSHRTITLNVHRSSLLIDSFNILWNKKPEEYMADFKTTFIGERGIDAGGLTKDWFTLIAKELFNPNIGLFKETMNGSYFPSPLSSVNENHIDYFRMAGAIVARALLGGQCINAHLSTAFLKQILKQNLNLKDLEDYDTELFNSLHDLREIDDSETIESFDFVFQIDDERFGKYETIDLIPNGENVAVTIANKNEYINLYTDYKLRKSVSDQVDAFCSAFYAIIPHEFIKNFSPNELDLMICGIHKFDLDDLKKHTHYQGYNANHKTIKMFWNVISKWDQEDLAKFLQFFTGISQVSVNGFKEFEDKGHPITISAIHEKNRLPMAHTCFNKLDLPMYDNEDDMNDKLLMAIQEQEYGNS